MSESEVAPVDPAPQFLEEVGVVVWPERPNLDDTQRAKRTLAAELARPQGEPQGQEGRPQAREQNGKQQQNRHHRTLGLTDDSRRSHAR